MGKYNRQTERESDLLIENANLIDKSGVFRLANLAVILQLLLFAHYNWPVKLFHRSAYKAFSKSIVTERGDYKHQRACVQALYHHFGCFKCGEHSA